MQVIQKLRTNNNRNRKMTKCIVLQVSALTPRHIVFHQSQLCNVVYHVTRRHIYQASAALQCAEDMYTNSRLEDLERSMRLKRMWKLIPQVGENQN